jgi:alpha-beta hydrolase superfamily lysophospholipase
MDFKGFGYSEGLRGFIEDRSEFYEEGFDFVIKARQYYQDTYKTTPPIFTMGYSQGGALALGIARLLNERSLPSLGG